ncbi:EamA family transporter [Cellulomonas hominis]
MSEPLPTGRPPLPAVLPVATAVLGLRHTHERPGPRFWVPAVVGAAVVMAFSARDGLGGAGWADLLLVAAVLAGALAYAEGAVLTPVLGSWQVTCWALLVSLPVLGPVLAVDLVRHPPHAPATAWAAVVWMALVGMLGGFIAWYHAMAAGGVARISQMQLVQPLLTIAWSAVLLSEPLPASLLTAGVATVVCVAAAQRSRR